jgi:hypothetical protein
VLSAFTHLWNPIGFPSLHADEGTYINRAMQIFEGEGPLPQGAPFYDHPYFGQIFLASVLALIGYPDSLNPSDDGNVHSIEMLYLVPRVLMGLLAVADTFLIYKIAERRYNRKVALIASILFAVMPMTWLLRRIMLDNILLPFLLTSVLLAMHTKKPEFKNSRINKNIPIILLSGIFLGLAIFTKIPAFTMIPLVGFIIYSNNKNDYNSIFKSLGLWFIPVILIPLIWPAAALSVGQFDDWEDAVLWQAAERFDKPLYNTINTFFNIDPVLFVLSMAGLIFAAVKRDFFLLLWIAPFIIFIYLLTFSEILHLVLILPAFCIAAGGLIVSVSSKISRNKKLVRQILPFATISAISIFGLISTAMLITSDVTSTYFKTIAFIVHYLPDYNNDNNDANKVTLVGFRWVPSFSWITNYIFPKDIDYKKFYSDSPIKTENVLLIADRAFMRYLSDDQAEKNIEQAEMLYNTTENIARFKDNTPRYNYEIYPYASMEYNRIIGSIEIKTNY